MSGTDEKLFSTSGAYEPNYWPSQASVKCENYICLLNIPSNTIVYVHDVCKVSLGCEAVTPLSLDIAI